MISIYVNKKSFFFLSLLILKFLPVCGQSKYYISQTGSDLNNGLSPSTTWQSIAKVNSMFNTFPAGTTVLFKRGEIFYGSLIITKSGTVKRPIIIGSYGSGNKPVITGFTKVNTWVNLTGNIWESKSPVSTLPTCNMVVINGTEYAMGRFPNTGYLTYRSHTKNIAITTDLTGIPNWTGAEVVIKMVHFGLDRNRITTQHGGTISYKSADNNGAQPTDGFGFFIQDNARTLDTANEWYYNPITKKILIYSIGRPSNVELATIDTLVFINNHNYISFNDISLQGANKIAIRSLSSEHITIENCDINFSGVAGIDIGTSSNFMKINNCLINHSNDVGILNDTSIRIIITNNYVRNSGTFAGMGSQFFANTITSLTTLGNHIGIRSVGNYATISFNKIDSSGYNGIFFTGDSVVIEGNIINNYCFIKDDGGGIYSYSELSKKKWKTRAIKNNIVLNGVGAPLGTVNTPGYTNQTAGIYLDAANGNFDVTGNTVTSSDKGLFINNGRNINIYNNTFYNNRYNLFLSNYSKVFSMDSISLHNNILIAGPKTSLNIEWELQPDSIVGLKLPVSTYADSNYYAGKNLNGLQIAQNYIGHNRSLAEWKAYTNQETHSKSMIISNNVRLVYNETKANKIIVLHHNYVDVKGRLYSGKETLAPFSSVVLIQTN
jgi:parallel beta-helix repeat protein